jgi:hypothetical protein
MGSTFNKGSQQSGQATGYGNQLGFFAQAPGSTGNTAYEQLGRFLKQGQLPPSLSLTGPLQDLAHQQATANQGILDTGARGGMLQSALSNNILQGQMGRQNMLSNLQNQLFGQALGGTPVAMAGLGNSGNLLSNLGAQRIGQNQAFQGSLGQLAGMAGKAAFA